MALAALNSHVMAYDNLSWISSDFSDNLCTMATGGGLSLRLIYTTREQVYNFKRPSLITGITELATKSDLADRALFVRLPHIPLATRKSEDNFNRQFEAMRPSLLAALLDVVSGALARVAQVPEVNLPRMADFGKWIMAAQESLGWEAGEFERVFDENCRNKSETVLEASPVGRAVVKILASTDLHLPAERLLELLNREVDPSRMSLDERRRWPSSGRSLGDQLDKVEVDLRKMGIKLSRTRPGGVKTINLVAVGRKNRLSIDTDVRS